MRALIIFTLLSLIGCSKSHVPSDTTIALGDSQAKSVVYIAQADTSVTKAIPHSDSTGKIHLATAKEALSGAAKETVNGQNELTAIRKRIETLEDSDQKKQERLDAYHRQYIGDASWRIIHWVIAVWLILGLAGALLMEFGTGIFGVAGVWIIKFIPAAQIFTAIVGFFLSLFGLRKKVS